MNFKSLVRRYTDAGHVADAPGTLLGNSGIKHAFSFVVSSKDGAPEAVVDEPLPHPEVNEMKVLAFFAKVYDVKPKTAVMCLSSRIGAAAAGLAEEYKIVVLQNENPEQLSGMLSKVIDKTIGLG